MSSDAMLSIESWRRLLESPMLELCHLTEHELVIDRGFASSWLLGNVTDEAIEARVT